MALKPVGKRLWDRALPKDESRPRTVLISLSTLGRLLFIVDRQAILDALPVIVALNWGIPVGCLSGLMMRRIVRAALGRGQDNRDTSVLASAARIMSPTLRHVGTADGQVSELTMFCGFNGGLTTEGPLGPTRSVAFSSTPTGTGTDRGVHMDHPSADQIADAARRPAVGR